MKKMLVMAAFLACCSAGSAFAQSEGAKTTKPAATATEKGSSCCSSKSKADCGKKSKETAEACADKSGTKTAAAGKSSCCMKGHTEAKAETPAEKKN
jgi:hypothetical protein